MKEIITETTKGCSFTKIARGSEATPQNSVTYIHI